MGSHKLRGIRDLIETQGGKADFKSLPPGNYDKLRTVVNNRKTNDVEAGTVQKFIDSLPATRFNVSTRTYSGPQITHHSGKSNVFQLNINNDQVKALKEAPPMDELDENGQPTGNKVNLWDHWKKVQDMLVGTLHPVRPPTIGWIRWNGTPGQGPIHIEEIQSDLRPGRAQLQSKWSSHGYGKFPHHIQNAVDRIILGGKHDHHEVLLEGFHQWLRNQGHHGTVLHLPGSLFRGKLSGMSGYHGIRWSKSNPTNRPLPTGTLPVHYIDTYEKMPKNMGYAVNASSYGADDHPEQQGGVEEYYGMPFHTSPVRKTEEELEKMAIKDLPPQPVESKYRHEAVHDADHYLTPEHRAKGYSLKVRSGSGNYGEWIVADVIHDGRPVGGLSGSIGNVGGKPGFQLDLADIKDGHTGQGLGVPMYEAALAHAKNNFGATHVYGMTHSSLAHSVHKKLAEKHGLSYEGRPNIGGEQYPHKEMWEFASNRPYDYKYQPYLYTLKSELSKSFKKQSVPKGQRITDETDAYDYTHLLPEEARPNYKMLVMHYHSGQHAGRTDVHTYHVDSGSHIGEIAGWHTGDAIHPQDAYLDRDYRGAGIGKAMYQALYTHAASALGARRVRGGKHSSLAHNVHQKIANEHGLNYEAEPNIGVEGYPTAADWRGVRFSYDQRYKPYSYTLK
jgi:GNAT superfamily N-acetyltransferase